MRATAYRMNRTTFAVGLAVLVVVYGLLIVFIPGLPVANRWGEPPRGGARGPPTKPRP